MIPLYLTVTINNSDTNTTTYIDVLKISDTIVRAGIFTDDSDEYEVEIHNHTGTDLELLEKILHGRNVS